MPALPPDWQDFDSNRERYVPRAGAEYALDAWANAINGKRVLSFIAPLGSGKSWLVRGAQIRWEQGATRFVHLLEVPSLLRNPPDGNIATERDPRDMFEDDRLYSWLEESHAKARRLCADVREPAEIDRNVSPSKICSQFADALCRLCAQLDDPILIVDAYDELRNDDEASFFSELILEPLIQSECIRMVIPRRDDFKLQGIRLRFEEELLTWAHNDSLIVDHQFKRYPNSFPFHLHELKAYLPTYNWNHPFINDFLLNRARENFKQGRALVQIPNDLRNCLTALIVRYREGRNRFPPLSPQSIKVLFELLDLPEQWDELRLRRISKRRTSDPHMQTLFAYSLVVREDIFYRIAPGVRELLEIIRPDGESL